MNVFEFSDYRSFIKNYIKDRPAEGRGELKNMASQMGVNQTLLSQILSGTRNFTSEQAYFLSRHLGLSDIEQEYLLTLIQIERASAGEYKEYLKDKLGELKRKEQMLSRRGGDKKISPQTQAIYYSHWTYSAVRLFTSLPMGVTVSDVEDRFLLSTAQAQEILRFLCDSGLCTETMGRYKITGLSLELERSSPLQRQHLSNWRLRALEKSNHINQEEMMFTKVIAVNRADFVRVREKIADLMNEVAETTSTPEDVLCLNIDYFWAE